MTHYVPIGVQANGVSVGYCKSCGYYHQSPLPSETEVNALYNEDKFYASGRPDWFAKEEREYRAGLWDARYAWEMMQLPRLSAARRPHECRPLLDVGCGPGWAIKYWHEHWGDAFGVEPSRSAREAAAEDIEQYIFGSRDEAWHFSQEVPAITSWHIRMSLVLEHVVDPVAFIKSYLPFMDCPGDRIMVIVPNDFNPLQERIRGDYFISKHHINYFTTSGLHAVFNRCGLKVVHKSVTFPMELFVLMGLDYRGNDDLGRKCHNLRLRWEKMLGVTAYKLYQKWYRKHGWGRELIFVGEKI